MGPRKATVVAGEVNVHRDPNGKIVGQFKKGERVRIIAKPEGPPKHSLTWYNVESERDRGGLAGWVAEGNGKAVWLQLDAPHEEVDCPDPILEPRPRPPLMPDPPSQPFPGWPVFAVLAFLVVVAAVAWWGGR